MTRDKARAILGRARRDHMRGMAKALCMHSWLNTGQDWSRLAALKALGYKVTVAIPARYAT